MPRRTIADIVRRLIEKTEAGEQQWSAEGPGVFASEIASYSVVIESVDRDDAAPFKFSILTEDGSTVESIQSQSTQGLGPTTTERVGQQNQAIRALYVAARRQALGIDQALEEIARAIQLDDA